MAIFAFSGSVALLGYTMHNVADALTSVPLLFAFLLGRRAATRAYTCGFGRAEDLAGVFIVLVIAASAVAAGWAAFDRLLHPEQIAYLPYVALAGVIGFAGNEIIAQYRIRVGRRISSAALVADGLHARTDGCTSLAMVVAAGGAWVGWDWADPVVGLAITIAIAFVLIDAARQVYRRLMDAVDPALGDQAEATLRAIPGIREVASLRLRRPPSTPTRPPPRRRPPRRPVPPTPPAHRTGHGLTISVSRRYRGARGRPGRRHHRAPLAASRY